MKTGILGYDRYSEGIQAMPIHRDTYIGQSIIAQVGMIIQIITDGTIVTFTFDDASTIALTLNNGANLVNSDSRCTTITANADIIVS